jgi:hypothetical protein
VDGTVKRLLITVDTVLVSLKVVFSVESRSWQSTFRNADITFVLWVVAPDVTSGDLCQYTPGSKDR